MKWLQRVASIFISNLGSNMMERDVRSQFNIFSTIVDMHISTKHGEARDFVFVRFKQAKYDEFLLRSNPKIVLGGKKVTLAWACSLGSSGVAFSRVHSSNLSADDSMGVGVRVGALWKDKLTIKPSGTLRPTFKVSRPYSEYSKGFPSFMEVLVGNSDPPQLGLDMSRDPAANPSI